MKLTLKFATFSLFLAAAVEASSLGDTTLLERQPVLAHSNDHAHAREYSHPVRAKHLVETAKRSSQNSHPNRLGHAYEAPKVIKPADPGKCHPVGATAKITDLSGPNGHINWLNCGIHGSGWSPAPIKIEDLVVVSLESARHKTFSACSDHIIATFEKHGERLGIPPIMLAAFAMQESGCNPSAVGGAGEQGLMQITGEKCKGAPNGNCKDPDFNIRIGAEFFAATLASNGGHVLLAIGEYNGWTRGMTYDDATRGANICCTCQKNLDYVLQYTNGWMQGVDPYERGMGKYHNIVCPK